LGLGGGGGGGGGGVWGVGGGGWGWAGEPRSSGRPTEGAKRQTCSWTGWLKGGEGDDFVRAGQFVSKSPPVKRH